jgi:hypothetical protein
MDQGAAASMAEDGDYDDEDPVAKVCVCNHPHIRDFIEIPEQRFLCVLASTM